MAVAEQRWTKARAIAAFEKKARSEGCQLSGSAWPDFFIERAGFQAAVTILSSINRKLSPERVQVMTFLEKAGISVFVWAPDSGFRTFTSTDSVTLPTTGGGGATYRLDTTESPFTPSVPETLSQASEAKRLGPTEGVAQRQPMRGYRATNRARVASGDTDRVWAHYVETMNPRQKLAGEEERRIINQALKVATVDECCRAISACRKSDFHMGKNDRRRKYNRLSQILKGRRGKETTRERVDWWLDMADQSGTTTGASSAQMQEQKRLVQRGWQYKDDPEIVARANNAEAWLTQHGVEVIRGEDGYPTFGYAE